MEAENDKQYDKNLGSLVQKRGEMEEWEIFNLIIGLFVYFIISFY